MVHVISFKGVMEIFLGLSALVNASWTIGLNHKKVPIFDGF